jgi:hypothetical protein
MQEQEITHLRMYLILCSRNEEKSCKDIMQKLNYYLSEVAFPLVPFELGNPGR